MLRRLLLLLRGSLDLRLQSHTRRGSVVVRVTSIVQRATAEAGHPNWRWRRTRGLMRLEEQLLMLPVRLVLQSRRHVHIRRLREQLGIDRVHVHIQRGMELVPYSRIVKQLTSLIGRIQTVLHVGLRGVGIHIGEP